MSTFLGGIRVVSARRQIQVSSVFNVSRRVQKKEVAGEANWDLYMVIRLALDRLLLSFTCQMAV